MSNAPETKAAAAPARTTASNPKRCEQSSNSNDRLQALISWFDSVKESTPSDTCTLPEWVGIVRSNQYRATVEKIRAIMATLPENFTDAELEAAKKKAKPIKATLPAVTFSASMDTRAKDVPDENRNYQHTGILQIDVDIKDNIGTPMDEIRQRLMDHPSMIMVASSPSGGIKAAIAIPANLATHKQGYDAAKASLAACGVNIDGGTHDLPRLCFLTHDPDAWLRDEPPVVVNIPADVTVCLPDKAATKAGGIVIRNSGRSAVTLDDLTAMVNCTPRLDHNDWVSFINGAWHEFGEAATPIMAAAWPEETPGEYETKFAALYTRGEVTISTCIYLAQTHGKYRPPIPVRMVGLNVTHEHAQKIDEAIINGRFLAALDNDHRGLAQAYADIRFGQRCYVHDEKIWRFYQDGIWMRDDTGCTLNDLQHSLTPIILESVNDKVRKLDPKKDKAKIDHLQKRARCLYNLRTARSVLENAGVLPEFSSIRCNFDQAPHLLAIENGVLDFSGGGEFRDHSPDDMLTVKAPVAFDIDATCPVFDQFLYDVMCGDEELIQFLWESLAIAMTGFTHFDFVWFHFGDGSNGKGTFTQTIREIFGTGIFSTFDSALLVGNRETSSDDYKRATLEGVRLALGDELPDGRKLRTEELKKLIGGDAISARNPYEKPRDFLPTHKTWLCGNHKPEITSMDHGTWRRLLLIPWNARFAGDGLSRTERVAQHVAESSGILTRIMCAWSGVKTNGLSMPASVRAASADYQQSADQVRQFADRRIVKMTGMDIPLSEVRKAYDYWCDEEGEKPIAASNRKLGEELRRIGYTSKTGAGNRAMLENAFLPQESTGEANS
jgi:putative DNA primase/helicase